MSKRTTLAWFGDELIEKARRAAAIGVNKTMAEAVAYAKADHSFKNQTGTLERSVAIVNPATSAGTGQIWGRWGSASVAYAAFIEFGTMLRRAMPFLRPAAAVTYDNLAENIAEAFKRQK